MCNHKLAYHSEHADTMTVYCTVCNAQWEATMFIAPHADGEPPPFIDQFTGWPTQTNLQS